MIPISLFKDEMDGVEFEVIIAPNCKVSNLLINGEDWFISDVDLAQVIRAVANSEDIYEFRDAIKGVWREEKLLKLLTALGV